MVRLRTGGVALIERAGNLFANRTGPTTVCVLPSQPILFPGGAYNALGVLVHRVAFAWLQCIFNLRFDVAVADVNGIQFIAADATVEQLLAACFGIEIPFATQLYQWGGEWPVFIAHQKKRPVPGLWIGSNAFLFTGLRSEVGGSLTVLRVLTRENDIVAIRTENFFERAYVKLLGRINKCIGSLLRSLERSRTYASRGESRFGRRLLASEEHGCRQNRIHHCADDGPKKAEARLICRERFHSKAPPMINPRPFTCAAHHHHERLRLGNLHPHLVVAYSRRRGCPALGPLYPREPLDLPAGW